MPDRDRRGSRPGSAPPEPEPPIKREAPWLKDRPDLHRTEEESDLLPRDVEPEPPQDQRVPRAGDRPTPSQSGEPAVQGDATKARRRPS